MKRMVAFDMQIKRVTFVEVDVPEDISDNMLVEVATAAMDEAFDKYTAALGPAEMSPPWDDDEDFASHVILSEKEMGVITCPHVEVSATRALEIMLNVMRAEEKA